MPKKRWQQMDLQGGGLQGLNLSLKKALRKRGFAYALWLLFPLGLHRLYLREPWGAMAYVLLTLGTWLLWQSPWAWVPPALMMALALFDLYWIDQRVTALNKRIRMEAFFRAAQKAKGPP